VLIEGIDLYFFIFFRFVFLPLIINVNRPGFIFILIISCDSRNSMCFNLPECIFVAVAYTWAMVYDVWRSRRCTEHADGHKAEGIWRWSYGENGKPTFVRID